MIEINTWYSYAPAVKNDLLQPWLNFNFPPKNYVNNQLMTVYINLYRAFDFEFNFFRSIEESCVPNGGGGSLSCNGCGIPNQGCNWQGRCINAYQYCSVSSSSNSTNLSCTGLGGKTLSIGQTRSGTDQHVARIIRLSMKKTQTGWIILSEN
jgi:hypothetical protein